MLINRFKTISWDIVCIVFIIGVLFVIHSIYLTGNYLETGYEDWYMHVFRATLLRDHGLTNWTYYVGNGFDVWQAFQFVPHFMVALFSVLAGVSISKSILIVTTLLILVNGVSKYILFRVTKISSVLSCILSLGSSLIPQAIVSISDFSIFVGLSLLPIYLLIIYLNSKYPRLQTVTLLMIGLSAYIHPILMFVSISIWVFINFRLNLVENLQKLPGLIVFISLSSFYWVSAYFYSGSSFLDYNQTTTYFVSKLMNFPMLGYSYFLVLLMSIVVVGVFYYLGRKDTNIRLYISLVSLSTLIIVITYVSITYSPLPGIIIKLQFPRWGPFVAVMVALAFGIFVERFKKTNIMFYYLLVSLLSLVLFIELNDPTNRTSYIRYIQSVSIEKQSPVDLFFKNNADTYEPLIKIYSRYPTEDFVLSDLSFRNMWQYYHFSGSPFTFIYNNIINNLGSFEEPYQIFEDIVYLNGIKFIFLKSDSPTAKLLRLYVTRNDSSIELVDEIESNSTQYDVFAPTYDVRDFYIIDAYASFENLNYSIYNQNTDYAYATSYTKDFAEHLRNNSSTQTPTKIYFSSQNTIKIENLEPNKKIVLNTSYDKNWNVLNSAHKNIHLSNYGTSFLAVSNLNSDPVTLSIVKETPVSSRISYGVIAIGFMLGFILVIKDLYSEISIHRSKTMLRRSEVVR